MKKTKFSEAQIVGVLKELDGGTPATTIARRLGVHPNTIRAWRDNTPGSRRATSCGFASFEVENAQMRRIIVRKELEFDIIRDHGKKRLGPSRRKDAVMAIVAAGATQRVACRVVGISERAMQYRSRRRDEPALVDRIKALARERLRCGGGGC